MNFSRELNIILNDIYFSRKSNNQLTGDLHFLSESIKDDHKSVVKSVDNKINLLLAQKSIDLETLKAIEYNNALLLCKANPSNIIEHLEKALLEQRYYFLFSLLLILDGLKLEHPLKEKIKLIRVTLYNILNITAVPTHHNKSFHLFSLINIIINLSIERPDEWQEILKSSVNKILKDNNISVSSNFVFNENMLNNLLFILNKNIS